MRVCTAGSEWLSALLSKAIQCFCHFLSRIPELSHPFVDISPCLRFYFIFSPSLITRLPLFLENLPCTALTMLSFFFKAEYQHRHLLLHRHMMDAVRSIAASFFVNYFFDGNLIVLLGIRIQLRIAVIDSVYCLGKKDGFCADLNSTQYCSCIC